MSAISRRRFLRNAALAGGAAWAGPLLSGGARAGSRDPRTEAGKWLKPFSEGGPKFRPESSEEAARFPTAVSAAALVDGRVLYWNGLEGTDHAELPIGVNGGSWGEAHPSRARVLDLTGRKPRWSSPRPQDGGAGDMFCADQKILPGGRVVVAGGTEWVTDPEVEGVGPTDLYGRTETRIFDPETDRFKLEGSMHHRRWYPSLVTLPDGRILALSGVSQLVHNSSLIGAEASGPLPQNVNQAEVFDPDTGRWTLLEAERSLPLYPRIHLLPDGRVLFTGAGQMFTPAGESFDQLTWNFQALLDPKAEQWEQLDPGPFGARSGAFSVLLPLRPPYKEATVLLGGGTLGTTPGAYVATGFSELIGFEGGAVASAPGPQLGRPRWFSSPVLLPDGTVGVFNGGDVDDVIDPGSARAVRMAELYDPEEGSFRDLAEGRRERVYHNTAVLLADGSVLVGGHSPLPAHYGNHANQPGAASNFKDPSFEIYRPPYFFRGNRPRIASAPRRARRGDRVRVDTPDARRIDSAVLIRLGAATHTVDADQRAVFLRIRGRNRTGLTVEIPDDRAVLPPGPYYLFINRGEKRPVPSVAAVIRIR